MVLCLMVNCGNKTGKKSKKDVNITFSRVPSVVTNQGEAFEELTATRRRLWISAISRSDLTEEKLRNDRVCCRHFVSGKAAKDWDRFNVDWIPTLNLGHSKQQPTIDATLNEERLERRKRRQEIIESEIKAKLNKLSEPGETIENIFSTKTQQEIEDDSDSEQQEDVIDTAQEQGHYIDNDEYSMTSMNNKGTQTPTCRHSEAETQTDEFDYLFTATKIQPFTEDYFRDSPEKVRFYTGLPGFDVLKHVVDFVSPHAIRKTKTLSLFQEIVLVLMKLRLNVPNQDLAFRFDTSLATVSRIFSSWMVVLDVRLSPLIAWPEREELWRTMPMCFKYSFGTMTTIIIDCFEVFIERPSNLLARNQTFSHYKHHNTIKVLIAITPQGSICFLSKAWGGRTSDKYLTERCGLLDMLKPGDLVMADRGFTIEENLALRQAKLAIPAFTKGKSQLDPISVEKTRGIANVRIHVERVIGVLRQKYTILQGTLPIDFVMTTKSSSCPLIDRMIRVCSSLTNLCPSVVPFD